MAQARYTARTFGLVELHVCLIAVVAWQPTEPAGCSWRPRLGNCSSRGALVSAAPSARTATIGGRGHAILDEGTKGVLRTLVLGGSMLLYVLGIGWCAVLLVLFIGGGGGRERAWGLCMIFVLFPCFLWALGFGFFALRCLFASRFAIHRAEDVLRHIKLVQTRAALFVLSALFLPTATALLRAVRRPRRPSSLTSSATSRPSARGRGIDRDVAHDPVRPFDGRRPPPVFSNAAHRAPRPPRPARAARVRTRRAPSSPAAAAPSR